MLETPWYRFIIIFLMCLMKVTEIQAQCERPIVGENRIMVDMVGSDQQTFLNGANVTFKCSTGYRIVDYAASRTIICVETEWTNLELTCTKKSCGSLSDLLNGRYNYPDGVLFGATAVAQCNEGYFLVGGKTRNCRDNGWDGRDPECEEVKCAPPPGIQNGTFEPMDEVYVYSQVVTYSCNRDYTLFGESTIACSDNGTFHPLPPRCSLVACETPSIENADRVEGKRPPYGYKNSVRYQCVQGYTMNGSGSLVCEEDGWNPPPPTCIMVACETPSIENADRVEGKRPPYGYKNSVRYQCVQGYTMNGSGSLVCEEDGWNPPPPTCIMVACETPSIENADRVEGKRPPYGYKNSVRYQCVQGYTMNGSGSLVCEENGWNPPPPTCIIIRNPDPPTTAPPSDSTRVKPGLVIISVVYLLLPF